MFPIKYINNNLVWNKDNEVFAYYELIPYNYSFLSAEQKFIVHDSFRQLIAQSREGKIHALQIATESSIRSMQEQSKKLVTGKLKEVAYQKIDEQTEALVSMIGDNQVDYRFFLGFKLMVTEEQLNLKNIKKSAWLTFTEFLHEVNHTLMNDFVSMPNDEINRYMKMEKLLENKISRRFKVRRLEINDFGYLMEHLYGRDGIAYEDYEYQLPKKKLNKETLIKYYDLIRPTIFSVCGIDIRVLDDELAEALKKLPERKRNTLLMYYFLEMTESEIANLQKITQSGVFRNRHHALEIMKKILKEEH